MQVVAESDLLLKDIKNPAEESEDSDEDNQNPEDELPINQLTEG